VAWRGEAASVGGLFLIDVDQIEASGYWPGLGENQPVPRSPNAEAATAIPIPITTAVPGLAQPKRQASNGPHTMMPR
jgi:hypothetical protein